MKNPKNIITTIFVLAGLVLLNSCSGDTSGQNIESPTVTAQIAEAQISTVPKTYRFTGTVEGEQRITLSTKVMGRITELPAELGDAISPGDILLRVKNDNLLAQRKQVEANLAEANASLRNTKTNYNRMKALFEDNSATQKEMDDISTQLEAAEARVAALESKLAEINDLIDYTVIESPINGYVVQKMVSKGDMASPGQPLLAVEEVDNLEVLVSVPASQIGLFAAGDTLELYFSSVQQYLNGTVESVNPSAGASRQYEVKVSIPASTEAGSRVKPGMFADVVLQKGAEPVLTVPEEALVTRGQLTGLYTLNQNDELLLRWVKIGRQMNRQVEILSGIKEGERFVIAGDRKFSEGQQVTIQ